MATNFIRHARRFQEAVECYVYYIVLLIGGSHQSLATTYARRKNTTVVVIDGEEEVNRYRMLYQKYGITYFSLGRRDTLLTLSRSAAPDIQEAALRSGGMLAREGAGGAPAAAHLAAAKLVASDEFRGFTDQLIADIICATQGRPEAACVDPRISFGGGMGGGAAGPIVDATNHALLPLGIPILNTFHAIGPITYTGLSSIADMNSAAVMGDYVERMTDKSNPERDRIVTRLQMVEYLPVGTNAQLRNKLLELDDQALRSIELQECLLRIAPNLATLGELGNIRSRDLELFAEIDRKREVLPSVAHNLSVSLADALSGMQAHPLLVREARWEPTRRPLHRLSLAELANRVDEIPVEDLITAVMQPGEEVTYELYLDLGQRGEFDLTKLDAYNIDSPPTLSEARQRLENVLTFAVVLEQAMAEVNAMINSCKAAIPGALQKLKKTYRRLHCSGLRSYFGNAGAEFVEAGQALRDLAAQLRESEAQLAQLLRSNSAVHKEKTYLQESFQAVKVMLGRYVPRGRDSFHGGYVAVTDLENCFGELLRLTGEPESEQQEGLCGLAELVTIEGLAHCVGSPIAKVEAIANQVRFGKTKVKCPPHGAFPRTDRVVMVYCLPPMSTTFAEPMREAILLLDPTAVVVFNDETKAGITVSRYEFRGFANTDQLMVGLVQYGAKRLENSPTKALRYPTGKERMPQTRKPHAQHAQNGAASETFHSY